MKSLIRRAMLLAVVLLAPFVSAFAQPRILVPLRFYDGDRSDTMYFGIVAGANFCIVESDSFDGHAELFLPPTPPLGVIDARFLWPRTGSNAACFDQGSPCDFRPFTSTVQKDTFRFRIQMGPLGEEMFLSWPSGLSAYFTELTMDSAFDMLTDTIVSFSANYRFATGIIYSGGLVTSVEMASPIPPETFTLTQNYPNPFNPSTTIRYALPHTLFVTLTVYNTLGQQVAQLVNEQQQAGYHDAVFRGDGLASGVYFYRLSTSDFVQTRKLSLLR